MRLLLLLSALLAALSGVGGTRASAQPVQASAAAMPAAPRVTTARASFRFAAPSYAALPPLRLDLPRLVSAGTARLLYAERRRE